MTTSSSDQKLMGILCYLGILWLIPLLTEHKNDSFVKFHINQGILVSILMVIGFVPVVGWIIGIIGLVFAIIGIVNVVNMQQKPLPVIGGITLYK